MRIEDFYIGQKVKSIHNMTLKTPYIVEAIDTKRETVDVSWAGSNKYTKVAIFFFAPYEK